MSWVLSYLRGAPDTPIKFRQVQWKLKGSCDTNFAGASEARQKKPSTGYLFILGRGVISASSSLQRLTAQSTVHAEVAVLAATAKGGTLPSRGHIRARISVWQCPDSQRHQLILLIAPLFAAGARSSRRDSGYSDKASKGLYHAKNRQGRRPVVRKFDEAPRLCTTA